MAPTLRLRLAIAGLIIFGAACAQQSIDLSYEVVEDGSARPPKSVLIHASCALNSRGRNDAVHLVATAASGHNMHAIRVLYGPGSAICVAAGK